MGRDPVDRVEDRLFRQNAAQPAAPDRARRRRSLWRHEHAARRLDPGRLPPRARRDARLSVEIRRVFNENFGVYGVRKVRSQMLREGFEIARCTVSRLMRSMGVSARRRSAKLIMPMLRHFIATDRGFAKARRSTP